MHVYQILTGGVPRGRTSRYGAQQLHGRCLLDKTDDKGIASTTTEHLFLTLTAEPNGKALALLTIGIRTVPPVEIFELSLLDDDTRCIVGVPFSCFLVISDGEWLFLIRSRSGGTRAVGLSDSSELISLLTNRRLDHTGSHQTKGQDDVGSCQVVN